MAYDWRIVLALNTICLLICIWDGHKDRDPRAKLSFSVYQKPEKVKVVIVKPLSGQEHFSDGEHNSAYDHDAFLGDEAKAFDELTPEESQRRLGIIFDKIDTNSDGFVEPYELKKWIQWTQKKYILTDGKTQWRLHNPANNEKLKWTDYKKTTYGFINEYSTQSDDYKTYSKMMDRDRRRWEAADEDKDDALTQEEFFNFLHPEDVKHMQHIIILETIEDIDKDGDGKLSLEEYMSDLYRGEPGEEEPAWVQTERETFGGFRDKDKDGYLDQEEVKEWIMPNEFDHAEAETQHLVHSSDTDADGKLTKAEVLAKYDIFVGSQATDFGEALVKHDEF